MAQSCLPVGGTTNFPNRASNFQVLALANFHGEIQRTEMTPFT
jgi:hypothetical protein